MSLRCLIGVLLRVILSGVYGAWAAASTSSTGRLRRRGLEVVCEAATGRRPDSVAKRERQNEKHRIRNHARKAEMRTRMKKVADRRLVAAAAFFSPCCL